MTTNFKNTKRAGFYIKEGKIYLSVTSILSSIAKPALLNWAAREAYYATIKDPTISETAAVNAYLTARDNAASRGSTVHSLVELWKAGGEIPKTVPPPFQGYYSAFNKWLGDERVKIVEQEKTIFSEVNRIAGTCDMLVHLNGDEELSIIDMKTNKNGDLYPEIELQLSAYRAILQENGIKVTKMFGLGLAENGSYTFKRVEDCFDVFLHAKELFKWQNKEKIMKMEGVK